MQTGTQRGSSKRYRWMCPSLWLHLLYVSWSFRGHVFSSPTENLSWILLWKTILLRLLFVPALCPRSNLLINIFLALSANTNTVVWLICLSQGDNLSIFISPNPNSGDFLCQSGEHRSKYLTYIKIQLILQIITEDKDYHYHVHFRDEETDAQRRRITELSLRLRGPGSRLDAQEKLVQLNSSWKSNPFFQILLWSAHFKPTVHENATKETLYLLLKSFVCYITDVFLPLPYSFTFSKISLFSWAKNHNNIMTFVSFHKASFLVEKDLILSTSC